MAFTPDGEMLASGSADANIRLWRVSDGTRIGALRGHTDAVLSVAISAHGRTLASTSWDATVKLWSIPDGLLLDDYREEVGIAPECVRFSPDGSLFCYGRYDGSIVVARNPYYSPPCAPCDANCDGVVDESDIAPFIAALFGGSTPCSVCAGDVNGDGVFDVFDLEPFPDCLVR